MKPLLLLRAALASVILLVLLIWVAEVYCRLEAVYHPHTFSEREPVSIDIKPLKSGDSVPWFALPSASGEWISSDSFEKGPTILFFDALC